MPDEFHTRQALHSVHRWTDKIKELTRISWDDLERAPSFAAVAGKIKRLIEEVARIAWCVQTKLT
jgi:hypothetical protein